MNDTVADVLTRIRNALQADHDDALMPSSRLGIELARLLKQEGYIEDYSVEKARRSGSGRPTEAEFEWLRIKLKYTEDRDSVISGLERISKPGRRRYATVDELPRVLGGMGTAIVTTSRGVMTANEARRENVGGEVLAYVW
jgi:small subunit ribosomal protein S8